MQNLIQHSHLPALIAKASVKTFLTSSPDGWFIQIKSKQGSHTLIAERSKAPRVFRRMETAADYLRTLGVTTFIVENMLETKTTTPPKRARPDVSNSLRRTFANAADYEQWFRAEVEAGVAEADDPNGEWISNEVVMNDLKLLREEFRALGVSPANSI